MKIKIYQINQAKDKKHAKFQGLKDLRKFGIDGVHPEIYDEVFSGKVDCKTLEDIYRLFNTDHPPGHRGHSLSVSDIVQITENNNNYLHGFFYCDSIGFENISFDPKQTHKPDDLLRVVMVEPGKPAYDAEIENKLRSFQQAVRGNIEVFTPFYDNAVIICNEEGKIFELPDNFTDRKSVV